MKNATSAARDPFPLAIPDVPIQPNQNVRCAGGTPAPQLFGRPIFVVRPSRPHKTPTHPEHTNPSL